MSLRTGAMHRFGAAFALESGRTPSGCTHRSTPVAAILRNGAQQIVTLRSPVLPRPTISGFGLLAAAVALAAAPVRAQSEADDVRANVATWWETASRVAPGDWGIAVADEGGNLIWALEADQPLVPASAVKLFTTGFARSVLGSDARRPTRVVGSGQVNTATGQWVGDWALELNGDVTLERGAGYGPSLYDLAAQMYSQGIRRLSGPFKVRS